MWHLDAVAAKSDRTGQFGGRLNPQMSDPPTEKDRSGSRWGPPPDSDLIGLPLLVGIAVAVLVVAVAFIFIGGLAGLVVLIVVLVLALAVSYRVVTDSDPND